MADKAKLIQVCKGLLVCCSPNHADSFVDWLLNEFSEEGGEYSLDIQFYNAAYYRACREGLLYIAQQLWADDTLFRYNLAGAPHDQIYEEFLKSHIADQFVKGLVDFSSHWKLPKYEQIEFPDMKECIWSFKHHNPHSNTCNYTQWLQRTLVKSYLPWREYDTNLSSDEDVLWVYASMHFDMMTEDRANGVF